jgi:hypothetical protein
LANTGPVNDEKGIYNADDSAWGQPAGIVSALRHQRALRGPSTKFSLAPLQVNSSLVHERSQLGIQALRRAASVASRNVRAFHGGFPNRPRRRFFGWYEETSHHLLSPSSLLLLSKSPRSPSEDEDDHDQEHEHERARCTASGN